MRLQINFDMNKYDVDAIKQSSLPVGGSTKCMKRSLGSEQKLLSTAIFSRTMLNRARHCGKSD
ncbi:hypothetical protein TSUD_263370 [Trifolium subterraneum]|uniref:Uncharacterized protein n=1 Tax=Trifolium subterraneum TaxID=3900 RepID=A0A2Z6PEC6_TRISU|nr:hypothetical protein TSUD_263370 [Trifolium subterraneum]